ncbi:MAG: agmatinase [Clostridia bacterium]|nr:agmatinase [Clostridia bacterium]
MANDFDGMLPRTFIGCEAGYEESSIVLFGAPFDGTVTFRPGSRFAPSAMRADSFGLETYSPYQELCLENCAIHDAGDLDLPFGNPAKALEIIRGFTQRVVRDGKTPLMLGGEHLVTYPAVQSVFAKYPELCVLHFDAHTDLRDIYCGERLSHACVLRRVWELLGDGRIWQLGIRSGTREEFSWAAQGHTALYQYDLSGLDAAATQIGTRPVYITLDLDVLDPSAFPGTGTPEAGGVGFKELLRAIIALRPLNVVAADVVELSPHYDASGISTATACKAVREMGILLHRCSQGAGRRPA